MSKEVVKCDEEIGLAEYLKIIIGRKFTIITIFLLSILIAVWVIGHKSKIYESSVIISLGSISSKLVMDKTEVLQEIQSQRFLSEVYNSLKLDDVNLNLQDILSSEDVNNPNLIKLVIKYPNARDAARICNSIASNFIAKGNMFLNRKIEVMKTQILELEERRNEIKNLKVNFTNKLYKTKNLDPYYSMVQSTASNYESLNNSLVERIFLLKDQIATAKEFEVFKSAKISQMHINFNTKIIFYIFSSFGLLFSIGFVLFQELWKGITKRDKEG